MFLALIWESSSGWSSSGIGGSFLAIPVSISMVVVTRKKINNKKAISAIDPALISGKPLRLLAIIY